MAFVRILNTLLRDKQIGKRVVPIVPDESRTFGMEGMFRQFGIFSQVGQLYRPEDAKQLMFYKEDKSGQLLQEGINEPGAMSSWIAAATSYSSSNTPMIPFYIYYSMFGFQRVGDLAWAAGDMRARGFLIGGTAGRTTLNGEGLQHEDGHSHIFSATIPNCVSYDPTFSYEVAVIVQDGLRRMYAEQEDVFYYLTVMNENYEHPAMPEGAEAGILKGMYLFREGQGGKKKAPRVQLLGSGTILREVIAGADLLAQDFGIAADIWSCPSFTELRREAMAVERWNLLHPTEAPRQTYVETCLAGRGGPVIAATDYMRLFADQIRPYVPGRYKVLGTDGFGRSDYRKKLRHFFEVDRHWVAVAALKALAEEGKVEPSVVADAIRKYGIDPRSRPPGPSDRTDDALPACAPTRAGRSARPLEAARTGKRAGHQERSGAHQGPLGRRKQRGDRGENPRHRRLQGRSDHRGARQGGRSGQRRTTRSCRSSPTRPPWRCPRPRRGTVEKLLIKIGDKVSEGTPIVLLRGRRRGHDAAALAGRAAGAEARRNSRAPSQGRRRSPPQRRRRASRRRGRRRRAGGRQLRAGACEPERAAARARARASISTRSRAPARRAGSPRTTSRLSCAARPPAPAAARARRRHGHPRDPGGGLLQVRADRDQAAAPHQEDLGAAPAPRLAQRPARHPPDEADITEIDAYRKELDTAAKEKGFRVTLLAFLMKASVSALRQFPEFNASLSPEKDALILKKYYNIGIAVDTPDGLVVPVIKDVDRKGIHEISQELGDDLEEGARRQAGRRRHAGRDASRSPAWAASAARRSRRSSTRPRWRSSASCARRWRRSGTAPSSSRG